MDDVVNKAKYLHRNISPGNVMIPTNGEGVLNDWDHSSRIQKGGKSTNVFRTVSCMICAHAAVLNRRFDLGNMGIYVHCASFRP